VQLSPLRNTTDPCCGEHWRQVHNESSITQNSLILGCLHKSSQVPRLACSKMRTPTGGSYQPLQSLRHNG